MVKKMPKKSNRCLSNLQQFVSQEAGRPLKQRRLEYFSPTAPATVTTTTTTVLCAPSLQSALSSNDAVRRIPRSGIQLLEAVGQWVSHRRPPSLTVTPLRVVRRMVLSRLATEESKLKCVAFGLLNYIHLLKEEKTNSATDLFLVLLPKMDQCTKLEELMKLMDPTIGRSVGVHSSLGKKDKTSRRAPSSYLVTLCTTDVVQHVSATTLLSKVGVVLLLDPSPIEEERYATIATSLTAPQLLILLVGTTPSQVLHPSLSSAFQKRIPNESSNQKVPLGTLNTSNTTLEVQYTTAMGSSRVQLLLALLTKMSDRSGALPNTPKDLEAQPRCVTGRSVVIHFTTPQSCAFYCDVLYAMKLKKVAILCDSEEKIRGDKQKEDIKVEFCARFEEKIQQQVQGLEEGVVVLLSAYGLLPPSTNVLVAFEPIANVPFFASSLQSNIQQRGVHASIQVLICLFPHEEKEFLSLLRFSLEQCGTTTEPPPPSLQVTFSKLRTPSATSQFFLMQKFFSLHSKTFILQQKSYEGYRSFMNCYSRLKPVMVFDVKKLNLQKVGEQFGYQTDPPLLDLRTESTKFRPKRDVYKAAMGRLKRERQELTRRGALVVPEVDDE